MVDKMAVTKECESIFRSLVPKTGSGTSAFPRMLLIYAYVIAMFRLVIIYQYYAGLCLSIRLEIVYYILLK